MRNLTRRIDMRTRMLLLAALCVTLGADGRAAWRRHADDSGTIVVTITGFRNASGHARVALFNRETGFPDAESAAFRRIVARIDRDLVAVRFNDVPFGEYAVSMYHDANDDAKLNKGRFGVPKEGYGVSNNVVHAMRAPTFEEARFRFDDSSYAVTINVHY